MRGLFFLSLLALFITLSASANQLTVDSRTLRMNDLASVTVTLEGGFAEVDSVNPPLENLATVGEPWVSTEFAWINGVVSRRKIFRFRVRPLGPGHAKVGPMPIVSNDGLRQVLPAVSIEVAPDRILGSNDAESLLREMRASGREPVFVVSEVGKESAFTGEPVRITWFLYNAVNVEQWQIVSVPQLQDFWTEEIPVRNEQPERVVVGNEEMQRVPIRRVIVYPLRAGQLKIGGMAVDAAVMRPFRGGSFWRGFEGEMVETSFTSAPIVISAQPLPPGPPVDAVGDLVLQCEPPRQRNAGPVVVSVTLGGAGNVRAAAPPHFLEQVAGDVQTEGGEVSASREEGTVTMTRRWRYLIFPRREGLLYLPPLVVRSFDPSTAQRKELRCEAATIEAAAIAPAVPVTPSNEPVRTPERLARFLPWAGGGLLALVLLAVVLRWASRDLRIRRESRTLLEGKEPAEVRAALDARFDPTLLTEASDRGDAYRALRSLVDAADRGRDVAADAEGEIARRLRELLRILR
jgi:hypothetical protein